MSSYEDSLGHEYRSEREDYEDEAANDVHFADDEVTQLMPRAEQALRNELESLRSRMANARAFVISALKGAETGSAIELIRLDSVLTRALAQLGCAECGAAFSLDDAGQLSCVRKHGVHPGHCS